MAKEPWATIDAEGVRVHIPQEDGGEISFVVNIENAQALVVAVATKLATLKTTEGKKLVGKAVLSWLLGPEKK